MKRPHIITIGIVIILMVLGLWIYLLLYGTPERTSDVFANLGLVATSTTEVTDTSVTPVVPISGETQLSLTGSSLQQLTTKSVAGFGFASSSPHLLRYVEQGTGHLYEISLDEGTETQVSLTTVPQTTEAYFSPEATSVVLVSFNGQNRTVAVSTIDSEHQQLNLEELPSTAANISFRDDTTVLFTVEEQADTTSGYERDLTTKTQTRLFTAPFVDATVQWGRRLQNTYITPKPSMSLQSAVYKISKNTLTPLGSPQQGLTFVAHDAWTVMSYEKNDTYVGHVLTKNGTVADQAIPMIPEKCVFDVRFDQRIWCAAGYAPTKKSNFEDWYKGTVASDDYLWSTNLMDEQSIVIADFTKLSGRNVDVVNLQLNTDGNLFLFKNKTDQTLWLYRRD